MDGNEMGGQGLTLPAGVRPEPLRRFLEELSGAGVHRDKRVSSRERWAAFYRYDRTRSERERGLAISAYAALLELDLRDKRRALWDWDDWDDE